MRAFVLLSLLAAPALAANFTVTDLGDSGPGTLRQAITDADAAPGDDTVTFAVTGEIVVTSLLPVTTNLTITGPGAAALAVSYATQGSLVLFRVSNGAVASLSGLTLRRGGPQVALSAGTLTLDQVVIEDGLGRTAGAVSVSSGSLTITDSVIRNNAADPAFGGPGGISILSGTVDIQRTTFVGNVGVLGGALRTNSLSGTPTQVTLINDTFTANVADSGSPNDGGGALYLRGDSSTYVRIEHCTFTGNSTSSQSTVGGGGISAAGAHVVEIKSTIVSGNAAPVAPEIAGSFTSLGFNLFGDPSGATFTVAAGDQTNAPAGLGPLTDNGGPVPTHALLFTSRAIDQGSSVGIATDARGRRRIADAAAIANLAGGNGADVGAFELVPELAVTPATVTLADTTEQTFTVSGSALFGDAVCSAAPGFEVSRTQTGGYGPSITLPPDQADGVLLPTAAYVRAVAGSAAVGDVTCRSDAADPASFAVSYAGAPDAGSVGPCPDAGSATTAPGPAGCGCTSPGGALPLLALIALARGRMRRRR